MEGFHLENCLHYFSAQAVITSLHGPQTHRVEGLNSPAPMPSTTLYGVKAYNVEFWQSWEYSGIPQPQRRSPGHTLLPAKGLSLFFMTQCHHDFM